MVRVEDISILSCIIVSLYQGSSSMEDFVQALVQLDIKRDDSMMYWYILEAAKELRSIM